MVYNKFKRGFRSNLLAYITIAIFLLMTLFLIITADGFVHALVAILLFGGLLAFFVYDLFFAEVFVFHNDHFCTNLRGNNAKFMPRCFRKVSVPYHIITKLEKRYFGPKLFALRIYIQDDEPILYIFEKESARHFVYDKLWELAK